MALGLIDMLIMMMAALLLYEGSDAAIQQLLTWLASGPER